MSSWVRTQPSPPGGRCQTRTRGPSVPIDHLRHRHGRPRGQGPHRHGGGNSAADPGGGVATPIRGGSPASRWWPPTWPSRSEPGCRPCSTTPCGWPIPSTWCGSETAVSTRSGVGSRTRPSDTGAARTNRSIAFASSCSPAPSASTNVATTACCSDCAAVTLTTRSWGRGWPRSRCATSMALSGMTRSTTTPWARNQPAARRPNAAAVGPRSSSSTST